MIETALVFMILAVMLLASLIISGLLVKRATYQVIDRFCSYHAVQARRARRPEELGLVPPDFFQRLFRLRDYKPYVLQSLRRAGAVRVTQEGKLYLAEEKLRDSLKCKNLRLP
jgi:hypothetical protein